MNNKSGSESEIPRLKPCGHEPPQGDSQLHGVCLFCYRDRLGHLQKLCEEQNLTITTLREGGTAASQEATRLAKLVDEQERRIEWLMNQPDNALKARCLSMESQLAEQKAEVERLKKATLFDVCGDGTVSILKCLQCEAKIEPMTKLLAEQTERVRVMREALKDAKQTLNLARGRFIPEDSMGTATILAIIDSVKLIEQALNQESLGDGKWRCAHCNAWNEHEIFNCLNCERPRPPVSLGDGGKGE